MQPLIVSFLTFLLMANDSTSGARFTVRELPYAYDALAPQLSEETLRYHHDKHYAGYVAKLNELILDTPYEGQPLEDIILAADGAVYNNAAQAYDDIVTNISLDRLKAMYDVNVFTPMLLTKYAIRNMIFNRVGGSIVHISSISAHTGYKGLAMYASSKGALEAFSKNTAREWGEKGVRSNVVVPGFMDTAMSSTLSDEQKNRIYKRTSLKKATEVASVAETVAFLLSDRARSITGQNINVDAGTI